LDWVWLDFLFCLSDQEEEPYHGYLIRWGGGGREGYLAVVADGSRLLSYAPKFKIAAVAFHWIPLRDVADVTELQKSRLFDIKNAEIEIGIQTDNKFIDETKRMRGTAYVLLLVPNGITMDEFVTLRQAYLLGVKKLDGVSGPP